MLQMCKLIIECKQSTEWAFLLLWLPAVGQQFWMNVEKGYSRISGIWSQQSEINHRMAWVEKDHNDH